MPKNRIAIPPVFETRDHPLALAGEALMEKIALPVSFTLNERRPRNNPIIGDCYQNTPISPDGRRIAFCHFIWEKNKQGETARIDVWNISTLNLEKAFYLPDLGDQEPVNSHGATTIRKLMGICFVGNDHLALSLANGFLKIMRISDGAIVNEARLGGHLSSVTYWDGRLAVSVFPGASPMNEETAGVKIFRTDSLLKGEPFDAEEMICPSDFGGIILPREILFVDHGARLLCNGSNLRPDGYTNIVELYDLTQRRSELLLIEDDKVQSADIHGNPYSKAFCVTTRDNYKLLAPNNRVIIDEPLPEGLRGEDKHAGVSPDGTKWIIRKNGDVSLHLFQKGRAPIPFPSETGRICFAKFVSDDAVICMVRRGDRYELLAFTITASLPCRLKTSWLENTDFHRITPDGFDFSMDGSFFMADGNGQIRIFDQRFTLGKTLPSFRGAVKSIKSDPHENRVMLLSESEAIFSLSSTSNVPRLHSACRDGKEKDAGSGVKLITFIRNAPDATIKADCALRMSDDRNDLSVHLDDGRTVHLSSREAGCEIRHHAMPDNEIVAAFPLPSLPVGGDELRRRAVILLSNGTLLVFDPQAISDSIDSLEKVPGLKCFPDIPREPLGMCRISDDRIVAWTETKLFLLDLAADFSPSVGKTKDIAGIQNVKYDPVSGRLMIAFPSHIEFVTLGLETMFRLYLSAAGGVLIHVPYPEPLKRALNEKHPGYFRRQGVCDLSAFTVIDGKGALINDKHQRKDFLHQYENPFIVREAIADYGLFVQNLSATNRGATGTKSTPMIRHATSG